MKRVPHFEPLFVKSFSSDEMAQQMCNIGYKQRHAVRTQMETRYNNMNDESFIPTEQETKWGITKIEPASSYWWNFAYRLQNVIAELKRDPESNRASIVIDFPDAPPCFNSFSFKVMNNGLHLTCFARSLDLENGLPVDSIIFWKAALEPVAKALRLHTTFSTLTVVSTGAHTYKE